jgi:hypothetical protein
VGERGWAYQYEAFDDSKIEVLIPVQILTKSYSKRAEGMTMRARQGEGGGAVSTKTDRISIAEFVLRDGRVSAEL